MEEQYIMISPVVKKLAKKDDKYKGFLFSAICLFITRASFGSAGIVKSNLNRELLSLNKTGNWDKPHRLSMPGDLIAGYYTDCAFDGYPPIWIMEETREISRNPRIYILTKDEFLKWYIPPKVKKGKSYSPVPA